MVDTVCCFISKTK